MQPANSRTRRVNCTTTYVPRRRRNAATMMPSSSSHEIKHDMPRHDIPPPPPPPPSPPFLTRSSPLLPVARSLSYIRERRRNTLYRADDPCWRARITSFIHLCRRWSLPNRPLTVHRAAAAAAAASLIYCIPCKFRSLANLPSDQIAEEPSCRIASRSRSILSFFPDPSDSRSCFPMWRASPFLRAECIDFSRR